MKVWLITVGVFIVVVLALILVYMLSSSKQPQHVVQERFYAEKVVDVKTEKEPSIKVMLFYATWCPHCERYLKGGTYDTFQAAVTSDESIKAKVVFEKYDYDKNEALGDRYGISSFPTIVAVDQDEKVYRFNGDRDNKDHIIKFVKATIQKQSLSTGDYA